MDKETKDKIKNKILKKIKVYLLDSLKDIIDEEIEEFMMDEIEELEEIDEDDKDYKEIKEFIKAEIRLRSLF